MTYPPTLHPNSPDAHHEPCEQCHERTCQCRPCLNPYCGEMLPPSLFAICGDCQCEAGMAFHERYGVVPEVLTECGQWEHDGALYRTLWCMDGVLGFARGDLT